MRPTSLRTRILFLSSSLVVVTMALVLSILLLVLGGVMRSSTTRAVDRTNALLKQTIAHYQRELSVELAMLSDRQGTKDIYLADSPTICDHLEEQKAIIGCDWFVMIDPSGRVLGKTAQSPSWTQQRLPEFMKRTGALDGKKWSGTVQSGNTAAVISIKPIYVGDYHQATLITGLKIDDAFLRQIAEGAQVELMLSSDTVPIASTTSIRTLPLSKQPFRRIQIGEEVFLSGPGVSPSRNSIGNLQFTILTPESAITGPFQPLFTSFAAVMALGVVMSIVFGAMLAVSVTNPLQELLSAASELSAGRWPKPFSTDRKDEIGVLQNAFDGMTVSLRETRDRLVTMLDIDPLTEARNYRSFRERLEAEVADAPLERVSLGIVLLGIDNFEKYNQVYGPVAADRVLHRIAQLIRELAHPDDFVGRYGGDEFVIAVKNADPRFIAEALRSRIDEERDVTISVGFCALGGVLHSAELLLLAAKMAVNQAKAGGRNRVRMFQGFDQAVGEEELRSFLQQGSYAAVRALAEAVDAKDAYTRGHSQRVAFYARDLARICGHDPGFIDLVYVTGTLHDVGKIGVPDVALKKEGKLTDEEFEMIKLHPGLGEKIVGQIPQLHDTLQGIRSHHERWDGRGYPDNLEGESIPLIARILAVADTFDAMTSDRPYRKGMDIRVAEEEIRQCAGRQFDPEIAVEFADFLSRFESVEALLQYHNKKAA